MHFRHGGAVKKFQTAGAARRQIEFPLRAQTDSRSGRGFWIAAEINLGVLATPVITPLPAKGRNEDINYLK
jgi:hypothetical protein